MLNSPVLDLVILLSFTYFISSLMLSAVNEAIVNGLFRLRQRNLKAAMEYMMLDKDGKWKIFVQTKFISNPHIQSLMKKDGVYPSYIPAETFVSAIINMIGSDKYTKDNLAKAIDDNGVLPDSFKTVLKDKLAQANGDLKDFEDRMKKFYDDSMDRASGWYKRKLRIILFVLGLIMAICFNLDTIKICRDALRDTVKLKANVDNISAQVATYEYRKDSVGSTLITKTADGKRKEVKISEKGDLNSAIENEKKDFNQSRKDINDLRSTLENTAGFQLGYASPSDLFDQWLGGEKYDCLTHLGIFLLKLLGVIITAFALQLGSDYWFGLMTKAVNIRSSGKKPEESKKK